MLSIGAAISGQDQTASLAEPSQNPPAINDENAERRVEPRDEGRCALVVDDAPDIALLLGMLLEQAGYEVTTTHSATAGLEAAQTRQFDLVVSDIGMPGMTGYELATELRSLAEYRHVPFVAVTGFAQYADHDRALASGFNIYLSKPIDPLKFVELVKHL